MPFPFLGNSSRTYTQFRDLAADTPLIAEPGGVYDMGPAGGLDLPVPPGDGLWGPEVQVTGEAEPAPEPDAEPAPDEPPVGPPPPGLINVPAEPEEN